MHLSRPMGSPFPCSQLTVRIVEENQDVSFSFLPLEGLYLSSPNVMRDYHQSVCFQGETATCIMQSNSHTLYLGDSLEKEAGAVKCARQTQICTARRHPAAALSQKTQGCQTAQRDVGGLILPCWAEVSTTRRGSVDAASAQS